MRQKILIITLIVFAVVGYIYLFNSENNYNIVEKGENFVIYDLTKDNKPQYLYKIYNNDKQLIKEEIVDRVNPQIQYIDKNCLELKLGAGPNTFVTQYFNVASGNISERYILTIAVGYGKIAFWGEEVERLIIRDIFDKNILYEEVYFDLSPTANPLDAIVSADFVSESKLELIYLSGDDYTQKKAEIDIK